MSRVLLRNLQECALKKCSFFVSKTLLMCGIAMPEREVVAADCVRQFCKEFDDSEVGANDTGYDEGNRDWKQQEMSHVHCVRCRRWLGRQGKDSDKGDVCSGVHAGVDDELFQ